MREREEAEARREGRPESISRRTFVRRAAVGAGAVGAAAAAGVGGALAYRRLSDRRTLSAWGDERPADGRAYFTPAEAAMAAVLADVVIPPGDGGPGATEAGVVEKLDRRLAEARGEARMFSRALLSFDHMADAEFGTSLADLSLEQGTAIVARAEEMYLASRSTGPVDAVTDKATVVRNMVTGVEPAKDSVSRVIRIVQEEFYTTPAAWDWLGYDGPPFPGGYPEVAAGCTEEPELWPLPANAAHGSLSEEGRRDRATCRQCHATGTRD